MKVSHDNTFGFNTYDLEFEHKGYNVTAHVSEANNNMRIITLSINDETYNDKEGKWSGRGKRSNVYYDLVIELKPIIYNMVCDYKKENNLYRFN